MMRKNALSAKKDGLFHTTDKCFVQRNQKRYNLKIEHFSTHTMRKTFGRKVFESAGENANMALMRLSELFNHSNVSITKIYLGLREQELLETYDLLDF